MATIILTVERLRSVLHYDSKSGNFTWKKSLRHGGKSRTAGTLRKDGYRHIRIDGTAYLSHRLAWLYVHGDWPKNQIDHINGDRLDNAIGNLRDAEAHINSQNHRRAWPNNRTSGLLGVSWNKRDKAWIAQISAKGVRRHIGTFPTKELAHDAYLSAKRTLHEGCTI